MVFFVGGGGAGWYWPSAGIFRGSISKLTIFGGLSIFSVFFFFLRERGAGIVKIVVRTFC